MAEATLENVAQDEVVALFGSRDENLRMLRETLGLKVVLRNGAIVLQGADSQVELGQKLLEHMRTRFKANQPLSLDEIRVYLNSSLSNANGGLQNPVDSYPVEIAGPMRRLRARTAGQARYVEALRNHDLTFAIGPAGTGKTYLAVGAALEALRARAIKRLVLVRPAVEAGEKLGYLPGDLQAKVHPYLRPLLDALREMLDFHQVRSYLENDIIEIAPLAYMRGRTLNESFIILDEAQNTTIPQMQMFLTRMGMGSRIVVTGDVTQVDLPPGTRNGLEDAIRRLQGIPRVAVTQMQKEDIVRHPLVQQIVNAYSQ